MNYYKRLESLYHKNTNNDNLIGTNRADLDDLHLILRDSRIKSAYKRNPIPRKSIPINKDFVESVLGKKNEDL